MNQTVGKWFSCSLRCMIQSWMLTSWCCPTKAEVATRRMYGANLARSPTAAWHTLIHLQYYDVPHRQERSRAANCNTPCKTILCSQDSAFSRISRSLPLLPLLVTALLFLESPQQHRLSLCFTADSLWRVTHSCWEIRLALPYQGSFALVIVVILLTAAIAPAAWTAGGITQLVAATYNTSWHQLDGSYNLCADSPWRCTLSCCHTAFILSICVQRRRLFIAAVTVANLVEHVANSCSFSPESQAIFDTAWLLWSQAR